MSAAGVALYCARALSFAAVALAVMYLVGRARKRRFRLRDYLAAAYLAALLQITVMRGGMDFARVFEGGRDAPRLVPLQTTLGELRAGAWPVLYHTLGNLAWFVPLGALLGMRRARTALAAGAVFSAGIELLQYVFRTGVTDVDDVLLNALGARIGWALFQLWRRARERRGNRIT